MIGLASLRLTSARRIELNPEHLCPEFVIGLDRQTSIGLGNDQIGNKAPMA